VEPGCRPGRRYCCTPRSSASNLLIAEGPDGRWRLSGLTGIEPVTRAKREQEFAGARVFAADGGSRFPTRTPATCG